MNQLKYISTIVREYIEIILREHEICYENTSYALPSIWIETLKNAKTSYLLLMSEPLDHIIYHQNSDFCPLPRSETKVGEVYRLVLVLKMM